VSAMQLSFGDAEGLGSRKRTRRQVFLAEMEQVVPWQALGSDRAALPEAVSDFLCVRRFSLGSSFNGPA
jgi:hypothetical protein